MKKKVLIAALSAILLVGCGLEESTMAADEVDNANVKSASSYEVQMEDASTEELPDDSIDESEILSDESMIEDFISSDGVRTVRIDDVTAEYNKVCSYWIVDKIDPQSLSKIWSYLASIYYADSGFPELRSMDHTTDVRIDYSGATEYFFNPERADGQPVATPWWKIPGILGDFEIMSHDFAESVEILKVDLYPDVPDGRIASIDERSPLNIAYEKSEGLYVLYPDGIRLYRGGALAQTWDIELKEGCFLEKTADCFTMFYDGAERIYSLSDDGYMNLTFDGVADAFLPSMVFGDGIGVLKINDGILTLYHLNDSHPRLADVKEIGDGVLDVRPIGDLSILLEKSDGIYLVELYTKVDLKENDYDYPDWSDDTVIVESNYLGAESIDYYAEKYDEFLYRGDFAGSFVDCCGQ